MSLYLYLPLFLSLSLSLSLYSSPSSLPLSLSLSLSLSLYSSPSSLKLSISLSLSLSLCFSLVPVPNTSHFHKNSIFFSAVIIYSSERLRYLNLPHRFHPKSYSFTPVLSKCEEHSFLQSPCLLHLIIDISTYQSFLIIS